MKFKTCFTFCLLLLALGEIAYAQESNPLLLPVEQNGKCGYIDRDGNIVIALKFDFCWKFSEGFASVTVGGKHGFIDTKGNYLIKPKFDGFWRFSQFREGLAPVFLGDHWRDKAKGKWGFIDTKGQVTYLSGVTLLGGFHDGLAFFKKGERAGYFDTNLKVTIEPNFKSVGHFYFGRARATTIDNSELYIDKSGRKVFDNREGSDFQDERAFFSVNGKYGFININGETIIEPQFDAANHFGEGLAAVKVKDKWGFIDAAAKFIIEPQFDETGVFSEGLASVAINGKWGFIDTTGKVVIPLQFDKWTYWFEDGVCEVHIDGKSGYIDKSGKYIWSPTK
ncbi:MAG: KWG Leptospira [Acidobacteria bacterium OLB17]|nr:MAG: KWG Leptospira [Acidobacteria bacterium OLB17]MCZ2391637.1 WG repeat-containing protein [Acidobacteriota bacterium]